MSTFTTGGFGAVSVLVERPTAVVAAMPTVAVLGSTVRLDGSGSINPTESELTYEWEVITAPIGSGTPFEPFRSITSDGASVWFSPDKVGEYIVQLTVTSGSFKSTAQTRVSVRAILVPDGRAIVPDGKFIWSYLRDVWQQVEDREMFETLWSALIQICGAELLKLYQFDFNKSIRDIQEKMQRRWLAYEPRLELTAAGMTAFIGDEEAGQGGATATLGREAKAVIFSQNELVVVEGSVLSDVPPFLNILYSRSSSNVGEYKTLGTNVGATGYKLSGTIPSPTADRVPDASTTYNPTFPFQGKTWSLASPPVPQYALKMSKYPATVDELSNIYSTSGGAVGVRAGDVAYIPTGVNAGFYRITDAAGIYIVVDRAPPSSSQPTDTVQIFRPVGIRFDPLPGSISDSFTIPQLTQSSSIASLAKGRLVTIGGRAYPVLRSTLDIRQPIPTFIITTDDAEVVTGRTNLNWRVPNTLVSPDVDFEAQGVTSGDLLLFDVSKEGGGQVAHVSAQVVGAHGKRLAFVLTTDSLTAGEGYAIPDSAYGSVFSTLGVSGVTTSPTGDVTFAGDALRLYNFLKSGIFAEKYWNQELDLSAGFVTPIGRFFVTPRAVVRNSKVPVDDSVLSIPALQEWVAHPTIVEKGGKVYQKRGQFEYLLPRRPFLLVEGNDYLTDGSIAFDDTVPFLTGTDVLEVDGAGFLSRQVGSGDSVSITGVSSLDLPYVVVEVLGEDRLKLSTQLPLVVSSVATARVVITRRRGGKYLRFLPGGFTATAPAPDRLWAEVSYFDNSDAIEANFGIMVGLKKEDLEKVTSKVSYRQAVAGLMFAYTRGSTIEKVRLGAQILLGLPFAEHRGIIRSMEDNYRTDSAGVPLLGRLLVEDVDDSGAALGVQRIYTYPVDLQSATLAGVEVNPATGVTYVVGDIVEAFSPLAKGVSVSDYLTDPVLGVGAAQLQQFHSFRLRANDNLFNIEEITLVSSFLRRITPSYVAFIISEVMELTDYVSIEDAISMVLRRAAGAGGITGLTDNVGTGIGTPFMFDQMDFSGHHLVRWDDGVFKLRRAGADATTIDLGGGEGAVTFSGDITTTSRPGQLIKVGDYVIFESGPNAGIYPITLVSYEGGHGVVVDTSAAAFTPLTNQEFVVARKVSEIVRTGTATGSTTSAATVGMGVKLVGGTPTTIPGVPTTRVTVNTGLILDGVMPGDWLLINGSRHVITGVEDAAMTFVPEDDIANGENYAVVRPSLIPTPSESTWTITSTGTDYLYTYSTNLYLLADHGDYLDVLTQGSSDFIASLYVIDSRAGIYLPVLPAGDYLVRVRKTKGAGAPLGLDFILAGGALDEVTLRLKAPANVSVADNSDTLSISGNVASGMGARVGDFIYFYDLNQVDVGYGMGVYPIASITVGSGTDTVVLSTVMADTGSTAWALLRRR